MCAGTGIFVIFATFHGTISILVTGGSTQPEMPQPVDPETWRTLGGDKEDYKTTAVDKDQGVFVVPVASVQTTAESKGEENRLKGEENGEESKPPLSSLLLHYGGADASEWKLCW